MEEKEILIVDDNTTTLCLLDQNLSKEGYHVTTASCGRDAIEQVKKHPPHLIIMDILLPDITGPDVIKSLQDDSFIESIPVLFLSAIVEKNKGGEPSDVKVGDRCYPAIGKPPSWEEMLNAVENALE